MFCQKCGTQIEDGVTSCTSCGNAVSDKLVNQTEPIKQSKNTGMKIMLAMITIAVLGYVVVKLLWHFDIWYGY